MSALAAAVSFGIATPIAFGPSIVLLAAGAWSKGKSRTEVADANEESLTKKLRASKPFVCVCVYVWCYFFFFFVWLFNCVVV